MTTSLKRFIKPSVLLALLWSSPVVLADSSNALAAVTGTGPQSASARAVNRRADLGTILSVLEWKMGSDPLPGKVREKLSTLSDGQIRLIASLSERMAVGGQTASADVAFLLVAALIVLS